MSDSPSPLQTFFESLKELVSTIESHPDQVGRPGLNPNERIALTKLDVRLGKLASELGYKFPPAPFAPPTSTRFLPGTNLAYCPTNMGWKLNPAPEWLIQVQGLLAEAEAQVEERKKRVAELPPIESLGDYPFETETPYGKMADVIHKVFWLAAKARKEGTDFLQELNSATSPWKQVEGKARGNPGRGIPFATFDPVLTSAGRILQELVQVASGNQSVQFNPLDPESANIMRRLKELAKPMRRRHRSMH